MKEKNVVISKQAVQVHVHEQKEAIMGKITRCYISIYPKTAREES